MARIQPALILISNEPDTPPDPGVSGFLKGCSDQMLKAEHDMAVALARARGTQIAIQLEEAGVLPHHLLSEPDPISQAIARRIADRAKRHPRHPNQPNRRPRGRRQRRSLLWSEGLLPKEINTQIHDSGVIERKLHSEAGAALSDFLRKLDAPPYNRHLHPTVIIVSNPYRLQRIERELTEGLGIEREQNQPYARLNLPPESARIFEAHVEDALSCR